MTQKRSSYAFGAGLFILLGFAALAYLATQTTSLANYQQGETYIVHADFDNIGQLKLRAPVKIAGVRVGSVAAIALEPERMDARVELAIDRRFSHIPDDTAASIFTAGLLGDQYVGLEPGGSPDMLEDGDQLVLTQSAMQLEDLIGKFLVSDSPKDN